MNENFIEFQNRTYFQKKMNEAKYRCIKSIKKKREK